ncbi:MAG: Trk system potassium transporter TrkA [Chitinophagales bacterium]
MRIVIAGAGEVGVHLAKLLAEEQHDIIIIDKNTTRLEYVESHIDVFTIKGDATCPTILQEANVSKTDLLIAATSIEANNITSCILGKKMGAKRCISRIGNANLFDDSIVDMQALGIDSMISPERMAANEIKRLIKRSAFTESFEFDGGQLNLVGIHVEQMSSLIGKQIKEIAQEQSELNFLMVAINRKGYTIIPRGHTRIELDDFAYFVTKSEGMTAIAKLTGKPQIKAHNVMLLGGTKIGIEAAELLSKKYHIKLIEENPEKCFEISDRLNNVLVINGDGRDVELLKEENIEDMDVFVAVTGNSAANIMSCLVAKAHGVAKTIALVENMNYIQLSQMVGIDTMINKKLLAANNIFRHIRSGEVLSLVSVHGVEAEVLEFNVKAGTKITKKTIKDLKFPEGAVIGGVIRNGEGMITLGDFQIQEDDHVVVFTIHDKIYAVEKFFN